MLIIEGTLAYYFVQNLTKILCYATLHFQHLLLPQFLYPLNISLLYIIGELKYKSKKQYLYKEKSSLLCILKCVICVMVI